MVALPPQEPAHILQQHEIGRVGHVVSQGDKREHMQQAGADATEPFRDDTERGEALSEELDDLLAAVDDVLEENAEEFVNQYVQAGGNGGGIYIEFFEAWIAAIAPERAQELLMLLRLATPDLYLDQFEPVLSWDYVEMVVDARYGSCAEKYIGEIHRDLPYISEMLNATLGESAARPLDRLGVDREGIRGHLQLELALRDSERKAHFAAARDMLLRMGTNELVSGLLEEFKYLLTSSEWELSNTRTAAYEIADFMRQLRRAVAPHYHHAIPDRQADEIEATSAEYQSDKPKSAEQSQDLQRVSTRPHERPHEKGDSLEDAAMRLIRLLFNLAPQEQQPILTRLRRQRPGPQYGHDIQFHASAAGAPSVRCRVECKNYGRPIQLSDIADKLFQQEKADRSSPIDHWILLSPHANPTNELQEFLDGWAADRRFQFEIQVWSPETGIRELLALEPSLYAAIYGGAPPTDIDPHNVIPQFRNRLQPVPRIHPRLVSYLREPWRMCVHKESAEHFDALYSDYVPLDATDTAGRLSPVPLMDMVKHWMVVEPARTTFLLLADFGDGKSFFTYALCRDLASQFLANPKQSYYPLRMSLKNLRSAGTAQEFLENNIERLGAPLDAWWELAGTHSTLVVLDAFDEMSAELDPVTVSGNLNLLSDVMDLISGPTTRENRGSKVLVTSRARFFDHPREDAAIRERLREPLSARIRPISRRQALVHLGKYAQSIGAEKKLLRVQRLRGPIGLAAKPLFLQLIKETLDELPDDRFDAGILYETYITKSLSRKSELLKAEQPFQLTADIVERLRRVLEVVAVHLHNGSGEHVDLRTIEDVEGVAIASLLWRMATQDAIQPGQTSLSLKERDEDRDRDARTRVSIRSLLQPIPSENEDEWYVDFFHRSMAEYFLAAAVARALQDDRLDILRDIIGRRPLSKETVEFVVGRIEPDERDKVVRRLSSVTRGATALLEGEEALGGNALTLYYALAGTLPDLREWSGLNLDFVALPGADLRDKDFSGTSLRFANLDNVDLRGANLRNADLTGVRIERTSQVDALAVDNDTSRIYAAYSDGFIRHWLLQANGTWSTETVFAGLPSGARELELLTPSIASALVGHELYVLSRGEAEWMLVSRTPVSPFVRSLSSVSGRVVWTVLGCEGGRLYKLDLEKNLLFDRPLVVGLDEVVPSTVAWRSGGSSARSIMRGCWLLSQARTGRGLDDFTLWNLETGRRWTIGPLESPTSFDIEQSEDEGRYAVAVGTEFGRLLVGLVRDEDVYVQLELVNLGKHEGPITTVRFLGKETIVTGGVDRCLRVWESIASDRSSGQDIATLQLVSCA
jgi:ubiquitin-like protein Pup